MSATQALDRALLGLAEDGRRPRCAEPGGFEIWCSDDPEDRATAARWCRGCPITQQCHAAAVEMKVSHGVWGGSDFSKNTRAPGRPKAGAA